MAGNNNTQDLGQLLKVRREKLADLQNAGKDPFQITKYNQTHHSSDVKALYEEHEAKILAGRAPLNTDRMRIIMREERSWTHSRSMYPLPDV